MSQITTSAKTAYNRLSVMKELENPKISTASKRISNPVRPNNNNNWENGHNKLSSKGD